MAYFDSPKNRAMWEKELAGLRRERAVAMCGREKAEDGREKAADGREKAENGWEKATDGREKAADGWEKAADGRKKAVGGNPETAGMGNPWEGRTKITFEQLLEDIHMKHAAGKLQREAPHSGKRLAGEKSQPEQKSQPVLKGREGRAL